jgi:pimeloyl-ACP methyl ester carboxylesterase
MADEESPGRVEMLNGVQIYFEVHGTGEPLLLLHGFSGSSQDWKSSTTEWGTDFQLIVPDLRGHARSSVLSKPFRRQYPDSLPEAQWEILRRRHPGGDAQIKAILASTRAFADSYDDMNFSPPYLSTIQARTLIVQGDHDPLYPVGPVIGDRWPEFLRTAAAFLRD